MNDQIPALINAIHLCRDEIGQIYANPQGVHFDADGCSHHIAKLVAVKAIRVAHDGSYRLDSRLKKFIDWAINRRSIYGNSTHYQDILSNLEVAVIGYLEALTRAESVELAEKIGAVFELCDDFSSGMTEDIERFRFFIEVQQGFTGDSLDEKILYNRNRLKRARELVENVSNVRELNLLETADQAEELTRVLRKELYSRHEEIQSRLHEVQTRLSATLFELESIDPKALRLINLDNYLVKHPDLAVPAWETMPKPPAWTTVFPGIKVIAYPDPSSETYGASLQAMITAIKDETPALALQKEKRSNEIVDQGELETKDIPISTYLASLYHFSDQAEREGRLSAMDWLVNNREGFAFNAVIWLQMLSNSHANGNLDIPQTLCAEPQREEVGDEYLLTDFLLKRQVPEPVDG